MWKRIENYLSWGSPITNREAIKDVVKSENELEVVGNPEHGTHKLDVVKDPTTGAEYVRKQTRSNAETSHEWMMGSFLRTVRQNNPEYKLTENHDGSVSVLSSKGNNVQDAEQFVRAGRTQELLNKEVEGLADVLVANNVLGEQSDIKLANILVEDQGNKLVFSNIDHERANKPTFTIFNSGENRYPTTPHELVGGIYDQYPASDENRSGLAGDPKAKEFVQVAERVITPKAIKSAYGKIASADTDSLNTRCISVAQNSTFFGGRNDCAAYKMYFDQLRQKSAETASKFDI